MLCIDGKSQIQALDRTAQMLPTQPGQPERRTHDYTRNETMTLLARPEDRDREGHRFVQARASSP